MTARRKRASPAFSPRFSGQRIAVQQMETAPFPHPRRRGTGPRPRKAAQQIGEMRRQRRPARGPDRQACRSASGGSGTPPSHGDSPIDPAARAAGRSADRGGDGRSRPRSGGRAGRSSLHHLRGEVQKGGLAAQRRQGGSPACPQAAAPGRPPAQTGRQRRTPVADRGFVHPLGGAERRAQSAVEPVAPRIDGDRGRIGDARQHRRGDLLARCRGRAPASRSPARKSPGRGA